MPPPSGGQQQQERPLWERALNWGGGLLEDAGTLVGDGAGIIDGAARVVETGGRGAKALGGAIPDIGPLGDVADIASGAGKMLHFDEQGNWDPNYGGIGDIVAGGAGLAGATPGVGAAVGGTAQALTNGYQAYEHFSAMSAETDPAKRADLERQAWGSTGDATIGALHAGIGSWCPLADLYITAGETVLDATGMAAGAIGGDDAKFGAGDVVGGVLDALIPEEEDAWSNQAGNWVNDQVGGGTTGMILGAGAAGVTNVVTAPVALADAGMGGIVNTVGNMFDSDEGNRDDYWGGFKGAAGGAISSGASAVADGASALWNW